MNRESNSVTTDHGVELTFPSDPRYMKMVRALVAAAAEMMGFGEPDINFICLAANEACTNIIRHAYDDDYTKSIELHLETHADRLEITLRDEGRHTSPANIKPRDLEDIKPGGLGVHFIREIMDEVTYTPRVEGGTELKMVKFMLKSV